MDMQALIDLMKEHGFEYGFVVDESDRITELGGGTR